MSGGGLEYEPQHNYENSESLVISVFEKIHHTLDTIKPVIGTLQESLLGFSQFMSDLDSIGSACELFSKLATEEQSFILENLSSGQLTEERCKAARHDLRAKVGAILGYSELMVEELLDEGLDEAAPAVQQLNDIAGQAKSLISVIDGLRIEGLSGGEAYSVADTASDIGEFKESETSYGEQFENATVLIIDDSAYNREILSRRLSRYGVHVLTAENGAIGLDVVAQKDVDLILLDFMMPVMNGFETLSRLKQDEKHKHIPVLMISALSEVDSIVRCIEVGAEDYLPTPFNPVILHARIKACLEKKLLRDREQENLNKLDIARQKLETAIESIDDGFAVYDANERLTMCNKQYQMLYPGVAKLGYQGFTKEELLRENYFLGVYFEDRRHQDVKVDNDDAAENWVRQTLAKHNLFEPYLLHLQDGRWIEVVSSRTPDGGYVSVHKDVTNQKEDEERLTHMALHDTLTGLYNRAAFDAQLKETYNASQQSGHSFAVMFLDLDGFKGINDSLGHEVGDNVLIHVAHALNKSIRAGDLVARLGGDEFAVIISEPVDRDVLAHVADRVLVAVGKEYDHQGQKAPFGVSIGIACYPQDGEDIDQLLANSDTAMYAAKKSGKGHYRFYSDVKDSQAQDATKVSFPVSI